MTADTSVGLTEHKYPGTDKWPHPKHCPLRQLIYRWYDSKKLQFCASRGTENMALKKTFCLNHPDRLAIGICVITGQAICEECSTRYEGVNYSREGLRILQARRNAENRRHGWRGRSWLILGTLLSPVSVLLIYLGLRAMISFMGLRS